MTNKTPRKSKKQRVPSTVAVADAQERAVLEAALRAFRDAKARLPKARDPKASREAYAAIFKATDEVAEMVVSAAEDEAEDEEPDVVVVDGVTWRAAVTCAKTYQSTRGPVRVTRRLYRSSRNGPTRCFFEERRGIIGGIFTQDLGHLVVKAVADLPAEAARRLVEAATGYDIASATMKRTTISVGTTMREQEEQFFAAVIDKQPISERARTVVISVDALSFNLRREGYKQATAATISLLDEVGERLHTIRLAEMPEQGKQTIMDRVEREVRSLVTRRPDLRAEVVIDGAPDLREHLLTRFPFATHVTDFFHVIEHISDALRLLFPDDEKSREAQRRSFCHRLKHEPGAAAEVLQWLKDSAWVHGDHVSKAVLKTVDGHARYIENQLPFIDYAAAANDNLDIGSGPVEAACKTLVTQRLKVSGAKWSRKGASAILYLRSVMQSGRVDDALDFHHAYPTRRAA